MKPIALLSYDYPPNDGGISRLCGAVMQELHRQGRQVSVLTLGATETAGLQRPDVPTTEVPRSKLLRELATARFLRQLQPGTCAIASVWNPEATVANLLGHRDLIVMAHGNEVMPYPSSLGFALKSALRRHVLRAARAVVCNSHYTQGLVQALVPGANTVVIPPGVDAERFANPQGCDTLRQRLGLPTHKRLLLSVSRMDAYKGHDVVLRALAALPEAVRTQLHYAVAGKGDHLASLKQQATQLGLDGTVTWLGFVSDADLPSLYAASDLFVLCTREEPQARGVEGFGMVFLEAQAAGTPVIGTRAGGIPDAIEPGNGGWLVEQDDVSAVRDLLTQLATNIAPFRTQGAFGQQRARTVGAWSHYVYQLLKVVDAKPH